jgi:hypothetical protein
VKRLTSNESIAYLGHLKNLLEQSGIGCVIKNEQLSGGLGEIPFLECLPELWVVHDSQLAEACGETNEGQFAACWHCGRVDDPGA